jgi:hypothetical protein
MPDLSLRATVIAGETAADDYQAFWNGLSIGRILQQPGVPIGRRNWHWSMAFQAGLNQGAIAAVAAISMSASARFKVAWSGIEPTLTEADIEEAQERR